MLTLLFAATRSCEFAFSNVERFTTTIGSTTNSLRREIALRCDARGKKLTTKHCWDDRERYEPQDRRIFSLVHSHLSLSLLSCRHQCHQTEKSVKLSFVETFFGIAPLFAAACSLERMMLFCQTEPALDALFASSSSSSSFCRKKMITCVWNIIGVSDKLASHLPGRSHFLWPHMTSFSLSPSLSSSPLSIAGKIKFGIGLTQNTFLNSHPQAPSSFFLWLFELLWHRWSLVSYLFHPPPKVKCASHALPHKKIKIEDSSCFALNFDDSAVNAFPLSAALPWPFCCSW